MPDDETKIVVYCKLCDCYVKVLFSKEAVLKNSTFEGGLISGTFLHKVEKKEPHALLLYFDKNFNHRGTVCSKVIKSKTDLLKEKPK